MNDEQLRLLREKYGEERYAPDPNCQKCEGRGEFEFIDKTGIVPNHITPCACIFFKPEDMWIPRAIGAIAKRELAHMRKGR